MKTLAKVTTDGLHLYPELRNRVVVVGDNGKPDKFTTVTTVIDGTFTSVPIKSEYLTILNR